MTTPIDTLLTVCRNATHGDVTKADFPEGIGYILYLKEPDATYLTTFQPKRVEKMLEQIEKLQAGLRYASRFLDPENHDTDYTQKVMDDSESFLSSLSKEATR